MASDGDSGFAPGDIAKKDFPTSFRGYDQDLVRDYLRRLSFFLEQQKTGSKSSDDEETLNADVVAENKSLKQKVQRLERQLSADGSPPDDVAGFELLGNETARILETARSAAEDIVKRAEDRAATLQATSESEARATRQEAQQLLAAKQAEASGLVSKITDDATRQASRLIADGENKHKRSVAESKRILAEAQDRADFERASSESEANEILKEASKRREDILTDLVERRREGHHQLNQLASARSALVRSLSTTNSELSTLLAALSEKIELTPSTSYVKTVESKLDEVDVLVAELDGDRPKRRTATDYTAEKSDYTAKSESVTGFELTDGDDFDLADDTDLVELQLEDLSRLSTFDSNDPDTDTVTIDLVDIEEAAAIDDTDDDEPGDMSDSSTSKVADDDPTPSTNGGDSSTSSTATKKKDAVKAISDGGSRRKKTKSAKQDLSLDNATAELTEDSPFSAEIEVDEDLSKEIPLKLYTDGIAEPVQADKAREGDYKGQLAGEFIARDVAITRFGPALRRRLRRALNDDQSDVLNRLRGGGQGRKSTVTPNDLPSLGEQLTVYVEPLEEGLADLAQAGLAAGNGTVMPTDALHHLALQVAKHMVQNLRTPSVALVEGSTDGDREALHDPIRDLYRSVRSNVLDAVIEDAINEAFSLGLFASIRANSQLVWTSDPRWEPSPLCEINAATPGIEKGETFPSGHTRPLAMPGCRCLVLPVGSA